MIFTVLVCLDGDMVVFFFNVKNRRKSKFGVDSGVRVGGGSGVRFEREDDEWSCVCEFF